MNICKAAALAVSAAMLAVCAFFGCSAPVRERLSETAAEASASISESSAAPEDGLLMSSDFTGGTDGWAVYTNSEGKADISVSDGRLALSVAAPGDVSYAVQLYYDTVPLLKNGVYRLSYEISSDKDVTVDGVIQRNGGDYQAYTVKKLRLISETQTVEYEFTMTYDTDSMARLLFNCGKNGGETEGHTVYLDNVSLELIDGSKAEKISDGIYEPDILINQIGYKPYAPKTAVFRNAADETEFSVINAADGKTVYTGSLYGKRKNTEADEIDLYGDFTDVSESGEYYISCDGLDDSYTFTVDEDVYHDVMNDMVRMIYLQRCGCDVEDSVFGHTACHTSEALVYGTDDNYIDVSGGWHDAGDYGRYVTPVSKTIADLLNAYTYNPVIFGDDMGVPDSRNGIPDVLDEVRYGLEWLLKMQDVSGGVHHKVSCADFPAYVMPQEEKNQLIATPVSTPATADFCAVMAMGYEYYFSIDKDFAENCLSASERAWEFLEKNPDVIFSDPPDITTGDYGDMNDRDERYWAAAQLYRATGNAKYLDALSSVPASAGMDWCEVGTYADIALITMDGIDKDSDVYKNAYNTLMQSADLFCNRSEKNPYGEGIVSYHWASNMNVGNSAAALCMAYKLTGNEKYLLAADNGRHYLMGRNPNGVCYISGHGTVSPRNPHHRPSIAKGTAMPGMLAGGPDYKLEDPAAKTYLKDVPKSKCYIDDRESYSTNEVTTYWNSAAVIMLALLESEQ